MWYWGGGVHWWGWLLGLIGMVVFWGIIIWAVWYFVTGVTRRDGPHRRDAGDARRILDERLARGELGLEEYRRLRAAISGEDTAGGGPRPPVASGTPH